MMESLSAYSVEELEDMREGLCEAISILQHDYLSVGMLSHIPKEYVTLLNDIDDELFERSVLV